MIMKLLYIMEVLPDNIFLDSLLLNNLLIEW